MVRRVEPAAGERVINETLGIEWSNWDFPTHLAYSQRAMIDLWPTDVISAPETAHVLDYSSEQLDLGRLHVNEPGTGRNMSAEQLLERRMCNDALLVMHRGQVVHESWRNGMQETDRHVNHSTTKSLTTLLLGLAIEEGLVDPEASVTEYLPQMADLENWGKVSVQHALDMRTGLAYEEHYEDPDCICWSNFRATGYYPPQADTLPGYDAWLNLDPSGVAVTEGQLSLHLRDFARWAALFLYGGKNLAGQQVVSATFIQDIVTPREELRKAWQLGEYAEVIAPQGQYRNQTYVLDADCTQLAMLGIHGQFALVDLQRELLAVGYGSYPDQVGPVFVDSMFGLWELLRMEFPT